MAESVSWTELAGVRWTTKERNARKKAASPSRLACLLRDLKRNWNCEPILMMYCYDGGTVMMRFEVDRCPVKQLAVGDCPLPGSYCHSYIHRSRRNQYLQGELYPTSLGSFAPKILYNIV